MARGNGVEKRGKSKATVKNTGPTVPCEYGGKGTAGVSNESRAKLGKGLSRVAYEKGK